MPTILDPILGLLTQILFPNSSMNSGVGKQVYSMLPIMFVNVTAGQKNQALQNYVPAFKLFMQVPQSSTQSQVYAIIQRMLIQMAGPNLANAGGNYRTIMIQCQPSKLFAYGDGTDTIYFRSIPIPSHWITKQYDLPSGFTGAYNEFDFDEDYFEATFNGTTDYDITISSPGYETQTWHIVVTENPNPPVDEPQERK